MSSRIQIIKVNIPASANPEVTVSSIIDRLFNKVRRIAFYTHPNRDENQNLEMINGLKVSGKEVFPDGFDTALLFPRVDNAIFTDQVIPDCANDLVEVRFRYNGTPSAPITGKLILFLEK